MGRKFAPRYVDYTTFLRANSSGILNENVAVFLVFMRIVNSAAKVYILLINKEATHR